MSNAKFFLDTFETVENRCMFAKQTMYNFVQVYLLEKCTCKAACRYCTFDIYTVGGISMYLKNKILGLKKSREYTQSRAKLLLKALIS